MTEVLLAVVPHGLFLVLVVVAGRAIRKIGPF